MLLYSLLGNLYSLCLTQPAKKGVTLHTMRIIALIALAAVTFGFAACSQSAPAPTPAPAKSTVGYSK
jgi:hypothetical protein